MDRIDTKAGWERYHRVGVIVSDDLLVAMLGEVIDTIHSLERIYPKGEAALVITGLLPTYQALNSMVFHRGLPATTYPKL